MINIAFRSNTISICDNIITLSWYISIIFMLITRFVMKCVPHPQELPICLQMLPQQCPFVFSDWVMKEQQRYHLTRFLFCFYLFCSCVMHVYLYSIKYITSFHYIRQYKPRQNKTQGIIIYMVDLLI